MPMNPAPTTWRVVRITEDEKSAEITLARTSWSQPTDPSDDESDLIPADPGQPGAFWSDDGPTLVLALPRPQAVMFDVGRQYVLALSEIVDAPREEYEPA